MTSSIPDRVARCQQAITGYSDDDDSTSLVGLLADAYHWCDANDESFEKLRRQAYQHYLAEINTTERTKP